MTRENWGLLGHEWAVEMLREQLVHGATRCTQSVKPGVPCGKCRDCIQIEAMQHPDLAIIQADSEGGTLKVEQVRDLRRSLTLKPYQSAYRVAIFLRFQEATANAANALLKTLEEAPSYAVLILTANHLEELPSTIVSRCEVLHLQPLPPSMIESFLTEHGADLDRARVISHISGGRPGYALHLLGDPSLLAFREEKLNELRSLLPATRVDKFAYAEKLAKDKDRMRNVILIWLSFWRDVLLRVGGASTPLANVDRTEEIDTLAGRLNLAQARRVVSDLEKAITQLENNINARLLAEVLLLDWPRST